jgi:cysteine desulfurase / selenocysteine lyase
VTVIWLNNAATVFPKPIEVRDAVARALVEPPCEPGRTGGTIDASVPCRQEVAALLGVGDPSRVVLLPSATYATNAVIAGLLADGGHAIASSLEQHAVLRPLAHHVHSRGARVSWVDPDREGRVDPAAIGREITLETRLVALTHASNVTGGVQPIAAVAEVCARAHVPLLLDIAQTAGCVAIALDQLPGRVFAAFSGHKALCGPEGTGGLVVPDDGLAQTIVGGTGVRGEAELHPGELPLRHEAGTPNLPGLAGLAAGVRWVAAHGVGALGEQRAAHVAALRAALRTIPGIWLTPLPEDDGRVGIVSFGHPAHSPDEIGFALREAFGLEIRSGLHCAPRAHNWLGTAPLGTVRVSFGPDNTAADVTTLAEAVRRIVAS